MGSKRRIAKHILPIMESVRRPGQYWVEPFVGGANMIDKVSGNRIGSDSNKYVIALLKEMQKPQLTIPVIDETLYSHIRDNKSAYDPWLVGFAGFQMSYGSLWFSSYRQDSSGKRDYWREACDNIYKQIPNIRGVQFERQDYRQLQVPNESLIYCDPPYSGTTGYKNSGCFDHDEFWQWCRDMTGDGHTVFVSEYNAPPDFKAIWTGSIASSLARNTGGKFGVEKLFVHASTR